MIANPEQALDTLAREGLGLNPDDLGSPISSFIAFSIGASLPLMPFLLGLEPAIPIAAAISGAALFVVGAMLSLFSGRARFSAVCVCWPSAAPQPPRHILSDPCST
jgi:VIT1/CCC1 family predicted Fe2+/Mn2+ transporter